MKLEISTEKTASGFIMKFRGHVDMNTSPDVRASFAEIFRQGGTGFKAVFIDLSQVKYMDSSGIATLIEAMQNCMKVGARLRLVDLSPSVRDVFELAKLTTVFEIFPSISEASAGI